MGRGAVQGDLVDPVLLGALTLVTASGDDITCTYDAVRPVQDDDDEQSLLGAEGLAAL